jgi:serine/threonine-protein kinase
VAPGEVLAGKFKVERVLGAGGMGVVVAARHLELDERVAVKFLLSEAALNGEAAARFVREARAAVKIKSEHVARVIDVGRMDTGAPYMVMEYLEGSDLSARLAAGPIAIDDAVDYVLQACDAMAEAHALGIVHRDLKPANLFLTQRSDGSAVVKVLDFGISKVNVPDTADAGLTKTSAVMGSPYYMSPEQMKSSRDVDSRSDVWSLGVILYELVSGRPPFIGDTLPELLSAIMLDTPPKLETLRAEVPAELSAIMEQVLQKDRTKRYQTVGDLASALAAVAPRRSRFTLERVIKLSGTNAAIPPSSHASPGGSPTVVVAQGAGTSSTWSDSKTTLAAESKPNRTGLIIGIAALAAVLAAGGTLLAMRPPPASDAPVPVAAAPAPPPAVAQTPAVIATEPAKPEVAAAPSVVAPASAAPAPSPQPVVAKPAPAAAAPRPPAGRPTRPAAATAPEPSPITPPPPAPAPAPAAPTRRPGLQIDLK